MASLLPSNAAPDLCPGTASKIGGIGFCDVERIFLTAERRKLRRALRPEHANEMQSGFCRKPAVQAAYLLGLDSNFERRIEREVLCRVTPVPVPHWL